MEFLPPNPEREGYEFMGRYKDEKCSEIWSFVNDNVLSPQEEDFKELRLYAKWH